MMTHYLLRQSKFLHIPAKLNEYFSARNTELLGLPGYSSNWAPNDFFLFPYLKNKLHAQRFLLTEKPVEAFKNHVLKYYPHSGNVLNILKNNLKTFLPKIVSKLYDIFLTFYV